MIQDWIAFGETCAAFINNKSGDYCEYIIWENVPIINPDSVIPNPKDTINNAIKTYPDLITWLDELAYNEQSWLNTLDFSDDIVDGTVMAVVMAQGAVASMQNVIDIGTQVEAAERKQKIITIIEAFLGAFLLLIPSIGEGLDALLSTARIGRIFTLVSDVGSTGLSIYDVYQDPSSAPLAIFGALLAGFAARDADAMTTAAGFRRTLTADSDVVKSMGDIVQSSLAKVEKVTARKSDCDL